MSAALTFLLIGCLIQGVVCGWRVTMPETVEVMAGSSLIIPCYFEIDSKFENDLKSNCEAIWHNRNDYSASDRKLTAALGKKGDSTDKNCTSVFRDLCPHHSDTYYFRLHCNNPLKWTYKEPPVNIVVNDALTLKPSTLEVKEGTSVSLSCSAPAVCLSRPPTLTWTSSLDDSQRTLQENQDKTEVVTSVLSFTASHLHHGDIISCSAVYRKPDGSSDEAVTKSLTAVISYSPKNTKVSVSPSGPVPENRTVTLTCSSDANPPVKNYTWFRADGDQETFTGTGPVLTITTSRVNRLYFCKAENDLGDGRSSKHEIDVQYSPKDTTVSVSPSGPVPENRTVTLTCSSDANPPVKNYTWFRADGDQETFTGTGPVLTITTSRVNRIYFCKAENDLGDGRSENHEIDVQYSPKNTKVSVSPSGPVPENRTVTLTCSSDANPPVKNYTWFRVDGDQETLTGTGPVLTITTSTAIRPLFCKAGNDLGVGRSEKHTIDVQFPPKILLSSGCTRTAEQVNCSCEAVGNPSPSVLWYLDDQPVNQSNNFTIYSESLKDKHQRSIITMNLSQDRDLSFLLCSSINSLGSSSHKFCSNRLLIPAESQGLLHVFITSTGVLGLCVLLLFLRVLKDYHNKSQLTGETNTAASGLPLIREGNEVPNALEDGIYVNSREMRQEAAAQPSAASQQNNESLSSPASAEGASKSSGKDGEDVVYTAVIWKNKNNKKEDKDSGDMGPSGGFDLEEKSVGKDASKDLEMENLNEKVEPRNVENKVECEYAQVKFKKKAA